MALTYPAFGATIEELVGEKYADNCDGLGTARFHYKHDVLSMELDMKDVEPEDMEFYATWGYGESYSSYFDRTQSLLELHHYLQRCGINPDRVWPVSDHLKQYMEIAGETYKERGIDVPAPTFIDKTEPEPTLDDGTPVARWNLAALPSGRFHPLDITVDAKGNIHMLGNSYPAGPNTLVQLSQNGTFLEQETILRDLITGYADNLVIDSDGSIFFPTTSQYVLKGYGGLEDLEAIMRQDYGDRVNMFIARFLKPDLEQKYPTYAAQFGRVRDIAIDNHNNVFVADSGSRSVHVFEYGGKSVTPDKIGERSSPIAFPIGISIDAKGNLYVADSESKQVHKFTSSGIHVSSWGSAGKDQGQFSELVDVAVGGNVVYALDYYVEKCGNALPDSYADNCYFSRIQKFSEGGKFISIWQISEAGDYYKPLRMESGPDGSLFVIFEERPQVVVIGESAAATDNTAANQGQPSSESSTQSTEPNPESVSTTNPLSGESQSSSQSGESSTKSGGGCLIATAAYGSEFAPQVQMLREIRDNQLLKTSSGSAFMSAFNSFYYSWSPTVAEWERQNPIFKELVRASITPLISTLSLLTHVSMDTEEEALGYGIGVILLNIGIYFVGPVVGLMIVNRKFRKRSA